MQAAFTLCSNNYLAHAKTLGDSLKHFNPEVHFIVGLVDKLDPEIDYSFLYGFEIIPYDHIGFPVFEEMVTRYNVIEFNTGVKPFYFEYLFNKYGPDTIVYYLDPDIQCFAPFDEMRDFLRSNDFVITPHLTQPQLKVSAFETMILNTGIYNLGFIAIRNTESAGQFLKWWQSRMRNLCLIDYARGLFVDQIWVNFLTVFFDGVFVVKSPAYNMACWNFHERRLIEKDGRYFVNEPDVPLVFFHFSGFKPSDMKYICKIKTHEFTLDARPDLARIFFEYAQSLRDNKYSLFSQLKPRLDFGSKKYSFKQKIGRSLKFRSNKFIKKNFNV